MIRVQIQCPAPPPTPHPLYIICGLEPSPELLQAEPWGAQRLSEGDPALPFPMAPSQRTLSNRCTWAVIPELRKPQMVALSQSGSGAQKRSRGS